MTVTGIIICTAIGWLMGYCRGKKIRKARVCQHGIATDALRCLSCAAAQVKRA